MTSLETTATTAGGWLWEKFGRDLIKAAVGSAKQRWSKHAWGERERLYRQRLLDAHSTTKLLGNPKEITLDKIYTDVYILDQLSAFRRLELEELDRNSDGDWGSLKTMKREPLLPLIQKEQRIYVLGKPGAGKSTFLKIIVGLCCAGKIDRTPIYIPLKQWSDSKKTLLTFIVDEFNVCQFPEAQPFIEMLLREGRAIVLLDGLDEISSEQNRRLEAIQTLTEFSRQYAASSIILTCRIAATDYSFDKFKYVEIADFDLPQQETFIKKWYAEQPQYHRRILDEWNLPDNARLRDLAKTPLLLALLCLAYDETLSFPRRRVDLYQEAVGALLKKWDASRGISRDDVYKGLSHLRREQLLSRVASDTFLSSEIFISKRKLISLVENYLADLPPDDTRYVIDGEAVVKAIEAQHGLLVERAYEIYSFSHLTIHEYFTAKYIVENSYGHTIEKAVKAHILDDQWREVFLMIASLLDNGRPLIDAQVKKLSELIASDIRFPSLLSYVQQSSYIPKRLSKLESGVTFTTSDVYKTIIEPCLSVSTNLYFFNVEDNLRHRVRIFISLLHKDPIFRRDHIELPTYDLLKKYVELVALFIESLKLVNLPNRDKYLKMIFAPI